VMHESGRSDGNAVDGSFARRTGICESRIRGL
jgi:hypothetical protein